MDGNVNRFSRWLAWPLIACLVGVAGCPAKETTNTNMNDAAMGMAANPCADDPRAQTYKPGIEQDGSMGQMHFTLLKSDPTPMIKGTNTWQLGLTDTSGNPVTNADITITPYMPDHGHGTSIIAKATAKDGGYELTPLYLFMGGIWEVTIAAKTDTLDDSAVFTFCIPD